MLYYYIITCIPLIINILKKINKKRNKPLAPELPIKGWFLTNNFLFKVFLFFQSGLTPKTK